MKIKQITPKSRKFGINSNPVKLIYLLFLVFILFSCQNTNQDERIVQNVENVLPGTWKIQEVNNLTSTDNFLTEVFYEEGNSISNFGFFHFPSFDLEFTEHNTIISNTINFELERDSVKYPLRILNENIITVNGIDFLQLDVVPNARGQFENKTTNLENMIDDLNLFHTPYIVEIESDDRIRLITSSIRDEISFDLVRAD